MTASTKQVLLHDGGHGTVSFVIGVERRPIYGYPVMMASRSTLMAATDWSAQMQDTAAEAHHLLAEQHLSDEQWKLFQAVWLYAHGDDQAFAGVTLTGDTAEQLRGYLGVDDSLDFRLATQNPPAVSDELQRLDESVRRILKRVAALPEEQIYDAVTAFDAAVQQNGIALHRDIDSDIPYAAELVLPLVHHEVPAVTYSDWNYRGQVASCMPPYVRQWVNDNRVTWYVDESKEVNICTEDDEGWVQCTVLESPACVRSAQLLIPQTADVYDGQHSVGGLARGMLYSPVVSEATHKLVIDKRTSESKGQAAWDALVQQYANQPLIVLAELLHEVIRVGRNTQMCLQASDVLLSIKDECQLLPGQFTTTRAPCHCSKRLQELSNRLDELMTAMNSDL